MKFNELVDEVKELPYDEKEELKSLIEKYLVDERRSKIKTAFDESRKECDNKSLPFSNNLDELKTRL